MSFHSPYRWCVVPNCKSSTLKTPEKLFIKVPDDIDMRNVWLKVSGRDPTKLSTKSLLRLCEDHFDLEQDMENYMQFKIMGSVKQIRMKPNIIPSKFSHIPFVCPDQADESTSTSVDYLFCDPASSTSYSKSNTGTQDPLETKPDEDVQCRFCGQFSNDCVAVSGHMPYLAGHKTALAINHIRIELDFSNHSLPNTVCRHCDAKLHEICEFVKQVNTAQFSLVTVCQNVNTQIVKAEFHDKVDIDALAITEEEYVKKTTIKRKSDDKGKNTSKKKSKTKIETEFIMNMDIKEEIIDDIDALTRTKKTTIKSISAGKGNNTSKKKAKTKIETEFIVDMDIKEEFIDDVNGLNPEYSDTESDVKPSESELANSALEYRMSEFSDLCNLTTNSGNSEIGKSVIDRGLSDKT